MCGSSVVEKGISISLHLIRPSMHLASPFMHMKELESKGIANNIRIYYYKTIHSLGSIVVELIYFLILYE